MLESLANDIVAGEMQVGDFVGQHDELALLYSKLSDLSHNHNIEEELLKVLTNLAAILKAQTIQKEFSKPVKEVASQHINAKPFITWLTELIERA